MSEPVTVDVYFDFTCPYVNSAALWLAEVSRQLGAEAPRITWKFFPLEEVNAPPESEIPLWELPAERRSRGRDSLHAAAAARRQGPEAFARFHAALLALKHERELDHGKQATLVQAAEEAGLDLTRFEADLADRSLLTQIRDDYLEARGTHAIFGVPTFVFPNGQAAYLQVLPPPPPEEAVPFWHDFVHSVRDRPYLREIKRPRKPS